jgi:hypothetical protein
MTTKREIVKYETINQGSRFTVDIEINGKYAGRASAKLRREAVAAAREYVDKIIDDPMFWED